MTASLHREADSDLTDAFRRYKREAGVGVAGRFLKEFRRISRLLESNPGLGTPNRGRAPDLSAAWFPLHGDLPRSRWWDPNGEMITWSAKLSRSCYK